MTVDKEVETTRDQWSRSNLTHYTNTCLAWLGNTTKISRLQFEPCTHRVQKTNIVLLGAVLACVRAHVCRKWRV
jgi:hypothetical protein